MDSDLSINDIVARCRQRCWLAVILAVAGLMVGFLVGRNMRYQSVITVWTIPVVVRDQPVSRVDEGFNEALYASMLFWLQEEWQNRMDNSPVDVTVRLDRQTYRLMAEGTDFGFEQEAAQTFSRFSAWIAGETVLEIETQAGLDDCLTDVDDDAMGLCLIEGHDEPGVVENPSLPVNSLTELVWVGELNGPAVNRKYLAMPWLASLIGFLIGFLVFVLFMVVDVSSRKPGQAS